MKQLILIITTVCLTACAGSPYQVSKMNVYQLRNVPDDQLYKTLQCKTTRNWSVLNEAKRRGWITDREAGLIKNNKIVIGISESALIISWGRPTKINKSVGSFGVHKQFVYGHYSKYYSPKFVYVENGKVSGWQE